MTKELTVNDLRLHKSWNGTHRGVNVEIANWTMGGGITDKTDCWNYYIILPVAQIPEVFKEQLVLKPTMKELTPGREWTSCDYMDSELINSLDWHCGCTFYDLEYDISGKLESIKMGCDYQHYWDEDHSYGTLQVLHDAKHTVDVLLEKVTLLLRCEWNGKYYPESEGSFNKWGNFVANENREQMAASFAESKSG